MTRSVDEGRVVDTIHLVFNKVLDMIFHSILVSKLGWYCLQGRTTRWVKNWLGCQALWVAVNGSYSAWRLVTNGAPRDVSWDLSSLTRSPITRRRRRWNTPSSNLQTTPKGRRVADTLEGRAAIQSRNLTFNKGKCRVLLLGWTNPTDGTGWGLMGWRAGLGGPWQWWGYMNSSMTSRSREVTIPFTQYLLCHIDNTVFSFGVPL